MRLVSWPGGFGRLQGDEVIPMGDDLVRFLSTGAADDLPSLPASRVAPLAPVPRPGKIICVGLNYRDHAREAEQPIPSTPVLFLKFANSVVGSGVKVLVPPAAHQVDYEAELGVVIGRPASRVSAAEAAGVVGGYLCVNDLSARDLQFETGQWTRGKAIDSFLPCGPWLVTPDEVGDPEALAIRCLVNGEERQRSNTSEMIFGVFDLISFISQTISLEPGDLIATGTPAGVGFARRPPAYLDDGDEVTVEIERLGRLSNLIVRPAA